MYLCTSVLGFWGCNYVDPKDPERENSESKGSTRYPKDPPRIRGIPRENCVDSKDPVGEKVGPKDPEGKLCGSEGSCGGKQWIRRIRRDNYVDPKDPVGENSGSQGSGGEIMWIRRNPWEKTVDPNDPPRIRGIPKENYVDSKDPVRG